MNYFISDLHLGHKNVLSFDHRPFTDIEENDKAIINNWNGVVGTTDDVYLLGDISWYNATKTVEILNNLNGCIHLIKGNHDGKLLKNKKLRSRFCEIVDYKELYLDKKSGIVLCHYPIPCFRNHYHGWYHLYGHVHVSHEEDMMKSVRKKLEETSKQPCNMWNVGCMKDYMNYTPRTLDEIIAADKDRKE